MSNQGRLRSPAVHPSHPLWCHVHVALLGSLGTTLWRPVAVHYRSTVWSGRDEIRQGNSFLNYVRGFCPTSTVLKIKMVMILLKKKKDDLMRSCDRPELIGINHSMSFLCLLWVQVSAAWERFVLACGCFPLYGGADRRLSVHGWRGEPGRALSLSLQSFGIKKKVSTLSDYCFQNYFFLSNWLYFFFNEHIKNTHIAQTWNGVGLTSWPLREETLLFLQRAKVLFSAFHIRAQPPVTAAPGCQTFF